MWFSWVWGKQQICIAIPGVCTDARVEFDNFQNVRLRTRLQLIYASQYANTAFRDVGVSTWTIFYSRTLNLTLLLYHV